jgi:hypothetical protein
LFVTLFSKSARTKKRSPRNAVPSAQSNKRTMQVPSRTEWRRTEWRRTEWRRTERRRTERMRTERMRTERMRTERRSEATSLVIQVTDGTRTE